MKLTNWAHYVRQAVLTVEEVRTETDWWLLLRWAGGGLLGITLLALLTVFELAVLGYKGEIPNGVLGRPFLENFGGVMFVLGGRWSYRRLVRWAKEPERVARLLVEEEEKRKRQQAFGSISTSAQQLAAHQAGLQNPYAVPYGSGQPWSGTP